ncbi:hypothetical protein XBKB1_3370004 [Xenorhabdus bovienii str. kraussei Becker Underwood]|uniref:Uncharacterized protein n=1 Tax=Xenorhabdus bovienii str. kraussei Becker Underwood TaxID=1398204 RepID=A0A077PW61_XENBV|nr:hypothetical protein XBKB1_3370004 [Xenorhabdus bovienii str. kraussei Becker Underwood]
MASCFRLTGILTIRKGKIGFICPQVLTITLALSTLVDRLTVCQLAVFFAAVLLKLEI